MATNVLPPASDATAASELHVEFPDNRLLIELCGEYDRNIAVIEQQIGIQILRRGNHLVVIGAADAAAEGLRILEALYARLEGGRTVEAGDIDREFRMEAEPVSILDEKGDQLEMFKPGGVEIKTRKKRVEPRTDAQKAYVQSLFENELAFGIGPAGTGKTYLAVAVAVNMFIEGNVDRIILSRPAVEAGEKLLNWVAAFIQVIDEDVGIDEDGLGFHFDSSEL